MTYAYNRKSQVALARAAVKAMGKHNYLSLYLLPMSHLWEKPI